MQAESVEFSRPEMHSRAGVPAAVVKPYGYGFVSSLSPHPAILCSSGDVINRPDVGWSPFDRYVSRDLRDADVELQEPVDLSLHRHEHQTAASCSISSVQHPTCTQGTYSENTRHLKHWTSCSNKGWYSICLYVCVSARYVKRLTEFGLFGIGLHVMMTLRSSLHCALASCGAVYCSRPCLWVCCRQRAGGRTGGRRVFVAGGRCPHLATASARSVCVSRSAFFIGIWILGGKSVFRVAGAWEGCTLLSAACHSSCRHHAELTAITHVSHSHAVLRPLYSNIIVFFSVITVTSSLPPYFLALKPCRG